MFPSVIGRLFVWWTTTMPQPNPAQEAALITLAFRQPVALEPLRLGLDESGWHAVSRLDTGDQQLQQAQRWGRCPPREKRLLFRAWAQPWSSALRLMAQEPISRSFFAQLRGAVQSNRTSHEHGAHDLADTQGGDSSR